MKQKYTCTYKNCKGLLVTEEVLGDTENMAKRTVMLAHPLAEILEVKQSDLVKNTPVATSAKINTKKTHIIIVVTLSFIIAALIAVVFYLLVDTHRDEAKLNHTRDDDIALQPESFRYCDAYRNIVSISRSDSVSTGFKLRVDGVVYLYTCYHCISSCNKVTCRDANDKVLELGNLEFCYDRDLVRFELPNETDGFDLAGTSALKIGADVLAYGDTAGRGVMTQNKGHILAFGNHKVEIDAAVLSGNSGGPVLDAKGRVVAIISSGSYDDSVWAKGTRYENVRKFAERADGGEWLCVSYDDYRDVYAFLYDTCIMIDELREYTRLTSGRKFGERVSRPFAYDQKYVGKTGYAKSIKDIYGAWNQMCDAEDEIDRLWKKSNGKVGTRVEENHYYEVVKRRNALLMMADYTLQLNLLRIVLGELRAIDVRYLKKTRTELIQDIETVLIPATEASRKFIDELEKNSYESYRSDYNKARN